jgi:hypothetical protein
LALQVAIAYYAAALAFKHRIRRHMRSLHSSKLLQDYRDGDGDHGNERPWRDAPSMDAYDKRFWHENVS